MFFSKIPEKPAYATKMMLVNAQHNIIYIPPTQKNDPEFDIFVVSSKFFFLVNIIRFFNIFTVFDATVIQPLNCERNKMFGIRNEANLF